MGPTPHDIPLTPETKDRFTSRLPLVPRSPSRGMRRAGSPASRSTTIPSGTCSSRETEPPPAEGCAPRPAAAIAERRRVVGVSPLTGGQESNGSASLLTRRRVLRALSRFSRRTSRSGISARTPEQKRRIGASGEMIGRVTAPAGLDGAIHIFENDFGFMTWRTRERVSPAPPTITDWRKTSE